MKNNMNTHKNPVDSHSLSYKTHRKKHACLVILNSNSSNLQTINNQPVNPRFNFFNKFEYKIEIHKQTRLTWYAFIYYMNWQTSRQKELGLSNISVQITNFFIPKFIEQLPKLKNLINKQKRKRGKEDEPWEKSVEEISREGGFAAVLRATDDSNGWRHCVSLSSDELRRLLPRRRYDHRRRPSAVVLSH